MKLKDNTLKKNRYKYREYKERGNFFKHLQVQKSHYLDLMN